MTRDSLVLSPGASGVLRAVVVAYVAGLVALPLMALAHQGLKGGVGAAWAVLSSPVAAHALWLTLWTALCMALLNAIMGTATAWVLVRYRFPGRGLLSAIIDLPFAVPTLVAGIMLVVLFGPRSTFGTWLAAHGLRVAFATPSIVLSLTFITLPFVVRAVEPVLMELDPAEEEAAGTLGAGPWRRFFQVVLPPLLPAIGSGAVQSFARAVAEFGSIVIVSGNMPHRTLTASVYVFGEIESGRPEAAAAVSVVLLAVAVALMFVTRGLERLAGSHRA